MNPKVSIIILNWNGWKDTIECLESLYQITYQNYDVIVVDNGSEDDSLEKIKEYAKGKIEVESKFFEYSDKNKPIKIVEYTREEAETGGGKEKEIDNLPSNRKLILIKNEKNYGFAEGNNIAKGYALKALNLNPKYVLLLNNDTVVDREFLGELVKVANSDERIGIVGPKIYYYDYDTRTDVINFAGADLVLWKAKEERYGCNEIDKGQYNKEREFDKLEGSCMMIRKNILKNIGLFHSEFFAYWEETDLCCRIRKRGYKLIYVQKAKIWHKKPVSGKGGNPLYVYNMTKNRFLFIKRNTNQIDKLKFVVYFFGFDGWRWFGINLHSGGIKVFRPFLKGLMDGIKIFVR